jgi:hypothetical protein
MAGDLVSAFSLIVRLLVDPDTTELEVERALALITHRGEGKGTA